jgi:hypothetical protein
MLSKRKEDASYTKSEGGGGTTGYVSAGEKQENWRRGAVAKQQHASVPILQYSINAPPKKARCGSGLNLSLEENR